MESAPPFASTSIDETRHVVSGALINHRLICDKGPLDASMHQCSVGNISLVRLRYGAAVRIEPECRYGFYIVQVPTRGHSRIQLSGAAFELDVTAGALLSPATPVAIDWSSQCEKYLVRIPTATLQHVVQTILDVPLDQLREFQQPSLLRETEARSLVALIEHVFLRQPNWGDSQANALLSRDAEELLVGSLVLGQCGNNHRLIAGPRPKFGRRYICEAEEYMRSNIRRAILLADVAQHVGVSIRTLHKAFRDFRGTTPMAILHSLRLAAVRDDLLSAPHGTRVADVARRWGFGHLGRFSTAYRKRYGEHPRQTIRN
jgi:AraC-like DNA-binding protein